MNKVSKLLELTESSARNEFEKFLSGISKDIATALRDMRNDPDNIPITASSAAFKMAGVTRERWYNELFR